jgi:hypothetical protein
MDVDRLRQLQGSLDGPMMDDEALRERLDRNYVWLESMAHAWQQLAAENDPALARFIAPGHASPGGMLPEAPVTERVDLEPLKLARLTRA